MRFHFKVYYSKSAAMLTPRSVYVLLVLVLQLLSVSVADIDNTGYLCDVCQCSETDVICNSLVHPDLLLTYRGENVLRLTITKSDLGHLKSGHFSKFENISSVTLNYNKFLIDSSSFSLLSDVKTLNLDNNSIEILQPGIFDNNIKLVNLSLNNNNIKCIGNGTFKNLQKLTNLYLANNSIEEVELDAWAGLESLEELDLSGNRLLRAQPEVSALAALHRLRVLRLGGNRITSLAPELVEVLAQRPDLSAQLSPNPLRCACDALELRAAWRAETARGLRLSLTCASGRPWDEQLRGLNCEDTDAKATEKELNDTTTGRIATDSTLQVNTTTFIETTSSDNPSYFNETTTTTTIGSTSVSSTGEEEYESKAETKLNLLVATSTVPEDISNIQHKTPEVNEENISEPQSSAEATEKYQHTHVVNTESTESESTNIQVEVFDGDIVHITSSQDRIDNIQSREYDTASNISPAQLVALAEGIEIANVILEVANTATEQPETSEEDDETPSPARVVAFAEGVEMVAAVAQAAKEVEPSVNAIWRAALEVESSFKENNTPQFEENHNTDVLTLLMCVLIVLCVTASAAAIVIYHRLKSLEEFNGSHPHVYDALVDDTESQESFVEYRSSSRVEDVRYTFPDFEEVPLP